MRFLIVDDQSAAIGMLRSIIVNHASWTVVAEAHSGSQAIARLDQEPHVVLMDIVMPDMDGVEATRRIKSLAPDTLVILTTAYVDEGFRTRSLDAGADGFIFKDDLTVKGLEAILRSKGRTTDE